MKLKCLFEGFARLTRPRSRIGVSPGIVSNLLGYTSGLTVSRLYLAYIDGHSTETQSQLLFAAASKLGRVFGWNVQASRSDVRQSTIVKACLSLPFQVPGS